MTFTYLFRNRPLGSTNKLPMWADDTFEVANRALFCPACGEVWGRVFSPGVKQWAPLSVPCSAPHTLWGNPQDAGSFIFSWQRSVAHLPDEVLSYEFLRLYEQAFRPTA